MNRLHASHSTNLMQATFSIEGTILFTCALMGTLCNFAVFTTIIASRRLRKPLHLLVGAHSACDLFVSLVYVPIYTYFLVAGANDATCNAATNVFLAVSSSALTFQLLISLYMYTMAAPSTTVQVLFSRRNTVFYILLAWSFNFGVLFVPGLTSETSPATTKTTAAVCFSSNLLTTLVVAQDFLGLWILHVIQIALIGVLLGAVLVSILRCKAYWDRKATCGRGGDDRLGYTRAAKTVLILLASILIALVPFYAVCVSDIHHKHLPEIVHHLVVDLVLIKSTFDPLIYIYGLRALRKEIGIACACRKWIGPAEGFANGSSFSGAYSGSYNIGNIATRQSRSENTDLSGVRF